MSRNVLPVTVMALALVAGCGFGRRSSRTRRPQESARVASISGIDIDRYWPREEVVNLSPEDRAKLLELGLAGLKGNNWQLAKDTLVSLGKESVPDLIQLLSSAAPTAAAAGPLPVTRVKTLGELAGDTLLEIVQYHSNYVGQLPPCDQAAWAAWWDQHGAGLTVHG